MKKLIITVSTIFLFIALAVSIAGMYKFNYLASKPGYDADGNKIKPSSSESTIHPSWDKNQDGINDCEKDGSCDHTIDYSKPRRIK